MSQCGGQFTVLPDMGDKVYPNFKHCAAPIVKRRS